MQHPIVKNALDAAARRIIPNFDSRWGSWHAFIEDAKRTGYIPTFREDLWGSDAALLNAAFPFPISWTGATT